MNAAGKIVVGGLLVGVMAGVAVHSALHKVPAAPMLQIVEDADEVASANPDISHCRAITAPDPVCTAAWDARRKAFFGEGSRP